MEKTVIAIVAAVIAIVAWMFWFDSTELSDPVVRHLTLVDKWHEEDCSPMYDGNGNYMGENCSDEWTIVFLEGGERKTMQVSRNNFTEFKAGQNIRYSYRLGRLGVKHDKEFVVEAN